MLGKMLAFALGYIAFLLLRGERRPASYKPTFEEIGGLETVTEPPVIQTPVPQPLPAPGTSKHDCPVCGWNPCTDSCRLGLSKYDLERMDEQFDPPFQPEDEP